MSVGAYEAKTRLAELLDLVENGERIVITRHGVPVAVLAPVDSPRHDDVQDVVRRLRAFRTGRKLGGLSLRALIAEGRK